MTQSPYDDDARERARSRYVVEPPDESYDPYRFGRPDEPAPAPSPPTAPGYYAPQPYAPPADPYAPQQPHYPPPPFHQYPQPRAGNGKAIAALVLGILSIVFCFASFFDLVLIIPAVVLGSIALNDAKRARGSGRGVAIGGLVCALVGAIAAIAITVWLYPKVMTCRNDYPQGSTEYNNCIQDIVQ